MNLRQIFLERYDPLYTFYFAGIWAQVPQDLMCRRPHPRLNSIAWNLWHLTRVEDAGLNRFVSDGVQVLDEGDWMQRMNLPWRHHGSGMTLDEVEELSRRVDLSALQGYSNAVQARTRRVVHALDRTTLGAVMEEGRLHQLMIDEGLAHSNAQGFIRNYLGWSKGKCLFNFGLTHPYLHLGEIEVIATLLGVTFE
jgi:hypothetical protein